MRLISHIISVSQVGIETEREKGARKEKTKEEMSIETDKQSPRGHL